MRADLKFTLVSLFRKGQAAKATWPFVEIAPVWDNLDEGVTCRSDSVPLLW